MVKMRASGVEWVWEVGRRVSEGWLAEQEGTAVMRRGREGGERGIRAGAGGQQGIRAGAEGKG